MAKLYDEARQLLNSHEALIHLRAIPGIASDDTAQTAADHALAIVVGALDRRVAQSHGTVELVEKLRSLDYSELRTPFMWNSTSTRAATGDTYLRAALANPDTEAGLHNVCRTLAELTCITPPAAERILADAAWTYCALIAQSVAGRLDLHGLRAALTADRRTARRLGFGQWLDVAGTPVHAVVDDHQSPFKPMTSTFDNHDAADLEPLIVNDPHFNDHPDVQSETQPGRATAMASTSGSGRYPPPIRREERNDYGHPRRTGPVPPPQRAGGAPAQRGRSRDRLDDTGRHYDLGAPTRDIGSEAFYSDTRQGPTRHRPISQPLGANRFEPPFEPPRTSRNALPLILGTVGFLVMGAAALWFFAGFLSSDDPELATAAEAADEATDGEATAEADLADPAGAEALDDAAATAEASADAQAAAEPTSGAENRIQLMVPMADTFTGNTAAVGSIGMTMDRVTGEICFGIETSGISPPYPAHIHRGAAGVKGPIAVDFTPQSDVAQSCIQVPPKNIQEMLADPANYYAEMHDAANERLTIRGQLSEATVNSDPGGIFGAPPMDSDVGFARDPNGDGAKIIVEGGTTYLRGEVADEATAQQLRDLVALASTEITVVDELVVDPAAPLPTGVIEVSDGIEFDSGSADLTLSAGPVIDGIGAIIVANPSWRLFITGHTDDVGGDVSNLDLSLRRAASVRDELVARGVPEDQLGVLGAGSRVPKVPNDSDANRALNRRIEFEIQN